MKKNFLLLLSATIISVICLGQNVGIGTTTPAVPLHVKSSSTSLFGVEIIKVEGQNPYIGFNDNIKGYVGYLWYNSDKMELGTRNGGFEPVVIAPNRNPTATFTWDGKVGIGTSAPSEKLDVNGNLNLNGLIKINGSSGTEGQVLTSNGSADPQWKNAAYGNNIRFSVSFQHSLAGQNGDARITGTRYNLNTANVTIGGANITINQSGLYHFDLMVTGFVYYLSAPVAHPLFDLYLYTGAPNGYALLNNKKMEPTSTGNLSWRVNEKVSLEVHITAPATLTIFHNFGSLSSSTYSVSGFLTGHLISE